MYKIIQGRDRYGFYEVSLYKIRTLIIFGVTLIVWKDHKYTYRRSNWADARRIVDILKNKHNIQP